MLTGDLEFILERKTKTLLPGSIAHLSAGVLFSFSYFLLWNWGIFNISITHSLIVDAISGILAIIVWKSYFVVYHNPPEAPLIHYFTDLFISHIIFGLVTVNVFRLITDNPQFWYQLQEEFNK